MRFTFDALRQDKANNVCIKIYLDIFDMFLDDIVDVFQTGLLSFFVKMI